MKYVFLLFLAVINHRFISRRLGGPSSLHPSLFNFHSQAINEDNSVVALNPKTMETLELFRGDTVLLKVRI